MKNILRIIPIVGATVILIQYLNRGDSEVSNKPAQSISFTGSTTKSEGRREEMTEAARGPEIAKQEVIPSFEDWRVIYQNSADEELKSRYEEISSKIDQWDLITKANLGTATDQDRNMLLNLIREQNALSAIQMERLTEQLKKEVKL